MMSGGGGTVLGEMVVLEHRGSVSVVRFNRPERMNALPAAGWLVFEERMREADADPTTGAIVVTGTGSAFCAGGDVSSMAAKQQLAAEGSGARAGARRVRHDGLGLVNTMLEMEKPMVAAVNGAAVGIGATVALLCDTVLMATSARMGDSHVPLGIVAGDGAIAVLPLLVGVHRAKELLLTGRLIGGDEAAAIGLVTAAVELLELESLALERAMDLAARPAYATRATKLAINRVLRANTELMLETAFAYEELSMGLPEHREALARFLEPSSERSADRAVEPGGVSGPS
jgi:enoyl-CoA hydratase